MILLGIVPWRVLAELAEPEIKVTPTVLALGLLLLALVVIDVVSGVFHRLTLYPARRLLVAASLSLIVLGTVSSTLQIQHGRAPLAVVGALPVLPGAWLLARLYRGLQEKPEEPRGLLRYVIPVVLGLMGLGERISGRLGVAEAADRAGLRWTRHEAAAITALVLLGGAVSACVILGIAALTGSRLLLAVSPLPLLVLPLLRLHLDAKAKERAKMAEEELPYLSLWAWMLERSGSGGLEDVLAEARRTGLMPAIGADAGKSLVELSQSHPSRRLRRFYTYYLAIRDTGGDVVMFLSDMLRTEIDALRARISAYAENGVALGTGLLGLLGTALIFVLFGVFLGAGGVGPAFAAILLAAPVGYLVLSTQQPRLREKYEDARAAAAAAISASAGLLVGTILGLPEFMLAGLPAILGLGVYGASFRAQRRVVAREERELLPLIRMVIEYARSMSDKPVPLLLEQAAASIEEPLAGAARAAARSGVITARSWLARYTLYTVVRLVGGRGAMDPLALERLYDLVYTHINAYEAASMRLRLLGVISAGFPPLIIVAAKRLQEMAESTVAPMLHALPVAYTGNIAETISWLALLGAGVMGFLASKAISLTVRDTLWPLVSILVTLLAALAF